MAAPRPSRSLTRQTLFQMAIRITAIVTVATVISYFHVKHNLQTQTLEQLQRYVQAVSYTHLDVYKRQELH